MLDSGSRELRVCKFASQEGAQGVLRGHGRGTPPLTVSHNLRGSSAGSAAASRAASRQRFPCFFWWRGRSPDDVLILRGLNMCWGNQRRNTEKPPSRQVVEKYSFLESWPQRGWGSGRVCHVLGGVFGGPVSGRVPRPVHWWQGMRIRLC